MASTGISGIVGAYFEALNWRRIEDGVSLFGEESRWEIPPLKAQFSGPTRYLNYWGMWHSAAPDFWLEIGQIKMARSWGACHYFLRGIHAGTLQTPLGVVCATGREFSLPVSEVYESASGHFTRIHTSFCLATLMVQLGLLPTAEEAPLSLHLLN